MIMFGMLFIANLKMIYRNRSALFWAMIFPLLFVVLFGLFRLDQPPTTTIVVIDYAQDTLSHTLLENLREIETFDIEQRQEESQARKDLKHGGLSYLLIIPEGLSRLVSENPPATVTLIYDEGSPASALIIGVIQRFLVSTNLELAHAPERLTLSAEGVLSSQVDYFDFLLPGFVGLGVMTFSIIGVATTMALYREQKILKRILATPLRVRTFFSAQILAYLVLSLIQASIILGAGIAFFGGQVHGNYLYIGGLVLLGNVVFLNLGFIVGAISKNVSAAAGLGNAVTMPMMFLSGTFFPTENLPSVLSTVVTYLPLAPMLSAMRGVALEARPFWDFPRELTILGIWILVTSIMAIKVFRFR